MKKALFSLFNCLLFLSLNAQYDKIISDPEITWAAEIELLLSPEASLNDWPFDSLNNSTVLKIINSASQDSILDEPAGLTDRLFQVMQEERWPAFDGQDMNKPLTVDEVNRLLVRWDTTVTFNPNVIDGTSVFQYVIYPEDCPLVRVRQLLYYREKTAEFGLVTRAIGPTLANGHTLFWMTLPEASWTVKKNRLNLRSPDITWARRLRTRAASPNLKGLSSLKRPDLPLMRVFLHHVRADSNLVVLEAGEWKPIPWADREMIFNRVDTLLIFDPVSYEEEVRIVPYELNPDKVVQLRLVQDWFWDDKHHLLFTRLVAVAPLLDVLDEEGNIRYIKPLFYRKSKQ